MSSFAGCAAEGGVTAAGAVLDGAAVAGVLLALGTVVAATATSLGTGVRVVSVAPAALDEPKTAPKILMTATMNTAATTAAPMRRRA